MYYMYIQYTYYLHSAAWCFSSSFTVEERNILLPSKMYIFIHIHIHIYMYTYVYKCIFDSPDFSLQSCWLHPLLLSGLAKACSQSCRHARGGPLSEGHGDLQILIYNCWIGLRGKPTGNYVFFWYHQILYYGENSRNISLKPMAMDMTCN